MAIFRQKSLDRLSSPEQLDKLIVITSPMTWLVLIGAALIVVVTIIWSIVSSIPTTMTASGLYTAANSQNGEVILYVPYTSSKSLNKKMPVNVYFTTFPKESFGHVEGKITNISSSVTTPKEMQKDVGPLASIFAAQAQKMGPLATIHVKLAKDSSSKSGYNWSTISGDKVKVKNNTVVNADIVTAEKSPISQVFPNVAG